MENILQTFVTLIGMVVIASGFVWAIKADTKLLAQRLDIMDKRLDKMDDVLENLANTKGRLDIFDERQMAQGRRLDEVSKRFTDWTEKVYEQRHRLLTSRLDHLETKRS